MMPTKPKTTIIIGDSRKIKIFLIKYWVKNCVR